MKKSKLILFSIISIVFLSGCGGPKIDKVLENMKNAKSYTMNVDLNQGSSESHAVFEVDLGSNISKQTSNISVSGVSNDSTIYSQVIDNKLTTYTKGIFGDNWIINEVDGVALEENKETSDIFSLDKSKFVKVKSSSKDITKYEVDLSDTDKPGDLKCFVYTDGKYITKIEMMSESSNYNSIITYSNINSTSVVIPDDVKENAKRITDINLSDIDMSKLNNFDVSGLDIGDLKEKIDKAKEYINSDEYKNKLNEIKDNISSDDFNSIFEQAQEQLNSSEYQRKVQEARDRANSILGR